MKKRHVIFLVGSVLLSMVRPFGVEPAYASIYFDEHDDAREALKNGDILPYSTIKKMVERKVGGKVVGQKLRRTNRGWQYDLRVRPENGRVMVLVVDAKTGSIVSQR
jgi:uncharacterized membrane protein YkoI